MREKISLSRRKRTKKNLEKDFSTVKSLDNISTQKWGKNSLPVEGLQKMFQWFIFLFSLGRALTMVCVRNVSRLQCYNCKWFTSKWELLSKYYVLLLITMLKTTEYETIKNTAPMIGSWLVENIFPYLLQWRPKELGTVWKTLLSNYFMELCS